VLLLLMPRIKIESAIASLERGVVREVVRGAEMGDAMIGRDAGGGVVLGAVAGTDVADAVVSFFPFLLRCMIISGYLMCNKLHVWRAQYAL
jgi:hypothetical protein